MKWLFSKFRALCATLLLTNGFFVYHAAAAEPTQPSKSEPTNEEFAPIAKAVLELLQSKDAARFSTQLVATVEDYQSILSKSKSISDEEALKPLKGQLERERINLEASAKAVIDRAESLHLDFSKLTLKPSVILPNVEQVSRLNFNDAPFTTKLIINITSDTTNGAATNEVYRLAVGDLTKFPNAWRSDATLRWLAFPASVTDDKTSRELLLLEKASQNEGFTDSEDPALRKLAEKMVQFVRGRDTNFFKNGIFMTSDQMWALVQKSGQKVASREEFEKDLAAHLSDEYELANSMLKLMADADIDLKDAEIQISNAAVERCRARGGHVDTCSKFSLKLAVKTDRKSKSNASLSGEYILTAGDLIWVEDQWRVMQNIAWHTLPPGAIESEAATTMRFENYIAEHGTLPTGKIAPEIEFTTLTDKKTMKLSDLHGKVVVLDFWATWCGPCQGPMAELQKIRESQPDWKDKVAIVPLSIDDKMDLVTAHVNKRGWTNTFNVWSGDGGWQSKPAKAFRVSGVPTTYILDAEGKIIAAGHPASLPIARLVNDLLKAANKP